MRYLHRVSGGPASESVSLQPALPKRHFLSSLGEAGPESDHHHASLSLRLSIELVALAVTAIVSSPRAALRPGFSQVCEIARGSQVILRHPLTG